MKTENYKAKPESYYETNPGLSHADLAVLLTADLIYQNVPEDLPEFRKKYTHLDPDIVQKPFNGTTFIKIHSSDDNEARIRDRLNAYMNIKFHDIVHSKNYEENAAIFRKYSMTASKIIDDILEKSAFPSQLIEALRERYEVKSCYDFSEMLKLYRNAKNSRVKYEVMRKLGLIVLIARINRSVEVEELGKRINQISEALSRGLRSSRDAKREYYFWLNVGHRIEYERNKKKAEIGYQRAMENRRRRGSGIYPLQNIACCPFRTFSGNEIVHMEIRNKFESTEKPSYSSYVEKMLRKNLEFPNQIQDTIGVKIVVNTEDDIPLIISDLESFLGGSSTRKMEKNSYHRFGRRGLSEYSSKEYFVWKAICDITLPHPWITQVEKILEITRDNKQAQQELKKQLHYMVNNPRDFVIEVQLQDIKSYLLSIAKGSPTEHAWLKMNQIRSNSFYKFFPKEIFQKELNNVKMNLLNQKGP